VLAAAGFRLVLINPLRTNRFAQEDLVRTKTDAIDALGIARFAQQKRPVETPLADAATQELKELVRLRERVLQDMGDATRRLHRSVDLGFPEFTEARAHRSNAEAAPRYLQRRHEQARIRAATRGDHVVTKKLAAGDGI
jgi:transposase